ncbi:MAG: integrase arm-type DNA-binding domain-containing protein [Kiritimatiellia bacterium]
MAKVLTAKAVEAAKPGSVRREIPDGGTGLYLVVQPTGARSWAYRFRVGGKPKKLTLGAYPLLGLSAAREAARQAADSVERGQDPAAGKRQAREEAPKLTVAAQVAEYHKRHLSGLRSGTGALRVLQLSAVAEWDDRPVTSITKREVVALIDDVHDERGPAAANMALARVRSFFNWLVDRDVIPTSPAARVRMPASLESRTRVLDDEELRLVWLAAESLTEPFGAFIRMLILTGQRRSEVAGMTNADREGDLWTIPGESTKNGKPHLVPFSPEALAVLNGIKPVSNFHVFSTNGRTPISGFSKAKVALDAAVAQLAEAEDVRRRAIGPSTICAGLARRASSLWASPRNTSSGSSTIVRRRRASSVSTSFTSSCPRSGPPSRLGVATFSGWSSRSRTTWWRSGRAGEPPRGLHLAADAPLPAERRGWAPRRGEGCCPVLCPVAGAGPNVAGQRDAYP